MLAHERGGVKLGCTSCAPYKGRIGHVSLFVADSAVADEVDGRLRKTEFQAFSFLLQFVHILPISLLRFTLQQLQRRRSVKGVLCGGREQVSNQGKQLRVIRDPRRINNKNV